MSSQCKSWWINRAYPWSHFRVSLMSLAAAFSTRWSLSVAVFGAAANTALQ